MLLPPALLLPKRGRAASRLREFRMDDSESPKETRQSSRLDRNGIRGIARDFLHLCLHLAVLLLSAGTVSWVNAWLCAGLGLGYQVVNALVLARLNPDLLNKRGRLIQRETKSFDKVFVAIYMPLALAGSVVPGLDAVRFGWSSMPVWMVALGVALYLLSCAFGSWAMVVNRHFESTVVVRRDGSQEVCSAGPYRIVRHPGYSAAIVGSLSYPCILGSWWGLVPVGLLAVLFVIRTALEDGTLKVELPGYREYASQTRHRLLPLIW
jgi:protein-S-isoprenylcysteine O-methyltransferase Ste14